MKSFILALLAVANILLGVLFMADLLMYYQSTQFMVSDNLNRPGISWVGCITCLLSGTLMYIHGAVEHNKQPKQF